MVRSGVFLFFVALASAAPNARVDRVFSTQFTISGTSGFNGVDAATLTLSKGKLTGTVEVISPGPVTYPCAVNPGSTLLRRKLNLTCRIGPDEMVTLSGTLSPATDKGRGTFSDTFFEEEGTYKSTAGDPASETLRTFTILTPAENDGVTALHNRMPVIVKAAHPGRPYGRGD